MQSLYQALQKRELEDSSARKIRPLSAALVIKAESFYLLHISNNNENVHITELKINL